MWNIKKISSETGIFLFIFLLYNLLTIPPLLFYGPFHEATKVAEGTIATSRHPQYLKFIYPEAKVRRILMELGSGENLTAEAQGTKLALGEFNDNRIELKSVSGKHYQGKMLLIHNPKLIRVITTKDLNNAGEKTSDIAKRVGAVAAINGGGFLDPNGKGNGGFPQGITIHQGKVITGAGTTEAQEIIGFDKDGVLVIGKYTPNELNKLAVQEAVSFGPQLINNGQSMVKGNGGWGIAPRTAIAQKKDGTVIFLTIDGRQLTSVGATLKEVQNILLEEGAYNAANLDGGSSTTMFYQGQVINSPANPFGERYVPTAFVVMSK